MPAARAVAADAQRPQTRSKMWDLERDFFRGRVTDRTVTVDVIVHLRQKLAAIGLKRWGLDLECRAKSPTQNPGPVQFAAVNSASEP